jgi:ferredoxin
MLLARIHWTSFHHPRHRRMKSLVFSGRSAPRIYQCFLQEIYTQQKGNEICKNFQRGYCKYGTRSCRYRHCLNLLDPVCGACYQVCTSQLIFFQVNQGILQSKKSRPKVMNSVPDVNSYGSCRIYVGGPHQRTHQPSLSSLS